MEDKCYLDSRLSRVVHSDPGSESATPLPSSQVTVPLVIDDNFTNVCSSLRVVQPSISSSLSSSLGISSQSFATPDALQFLSNQISLSRYIIKFTLRGDLVF